jgi:hypothetical protein
MDIGVAIGLAGVGIGVMGVVFGVWWTKYQARRGARSTLHLNIFRHFELQPAELEPDLSRVLKISWAGSQLDNLVCLGMSLRLDGYRDYEDPSARTPPQPGEPTRPHIDFKNFQVLSIGTLNNDPNLFEIPMAKAHNDTRVYVNLVRLRANVDALFTLVGTKEESGHPISAELSPGYVKEVDIRPGGLLTVPGSV